MTDKQALKLCKKIVDESSPSELSNRVKEHRYLERLDMWYNKKREDIIDGVNPPHKVNVPDALRSSFSDLELELSLGEFV